MKETCLDCEKFISCKKARSSWIDARAKYPGIEDQNIADRISFMANQFNLCDGRQTTLSRYLRHEKPLETG